MSRRAGVAVAVALLAALAATCTSEPPSRLAPADAERSLTLRVMEFNVEYGGGEVDFDGVPEAIEASGADVVAVEEAYGNMAEIAASVGWEHHDERTQVLSRYPILSPPGDEPFVYVEVAASRVVAVANVHLPSTGYGPFKVRDGATEVEVLAIEERKRLPEVDAVLSALEAPIENGVPVFLVGDFNAPSHLDWTEAAVRSREHVEFPIAWPVSLAVEAAGLTDSYREVHPDPVADPGLTWPANRPIVPGYNPYRRGAPADRIDFVYAGGPARVTESLLVGEGGGPDVDIDVDPWPTDHRAVVSTFEVEAAPAPTIVSVDRRLLDRGEVLSVRYHAPATGGSIAFVVAGGDPRDQAYDVVDGESLDATTGVVSRETDRWEPGAYEAVLLSRAGEELARAPFWIRPEGSSPGVETTRPVVDRGDPVEVTWRLAPGNRFDWIGLYRRGADPNVASYLLWAYTGATVEGAATFDGESPGAWPLGPGRYSVYLLRDDSYVTLAEGRFTVR